MQIFHNPNFNFVKYRWHALIVSWVLIIAGLVAIFTEGIPLGVEFSGGTQVVLQFDQQRPSIDQVRTALDQHFPGGGENVVVQTYGADGAARDHGARAAHGPGVGHRADDGPRTRSRRALKAANLGQVQRGRDRGRRARSSARS